MNQTTLLYVATFVANAAILIFEIAGARLLAPYLGTSAEVWSGTIAVVLGGMALGYWIGGIIADRYPNKKVLALILFGASVTAFLAWGMRDLVSLLFIGNHASLTLSAALSATFLFAPTTILLAAVSPFIAKFLPTALDSSAKTIGRINAIGTLGSITGAVASGAVLIPLLGLDTIFLSVALVILLLALLVGLEKLASKTLVLVLVGLVAFGASSIAEAALGSRLVADVATPYNRIWVRDISYKDTPVRTIHTDPFGIQCGMQRLPDGSFDETLILFPYLHAFDIVARTFEPDTAPSALFLGGCNYSFPRAYLHAFRDAKATVVEIDPGMTAVAQEYFGFEPARFPTLSVVHDDARRFLTTSDETFDVIFMDTFGSSSNVPHHLITEEAFASLRDRLTDNGVLIVNFISALAGPPLTFTASVAKTLEAAFPNAGLYRLSERTSYETQNLILIGTKNGTLPDTLRDPRYEDIVLTRIDTSTLTDGFVLTDNYAPVEYLTSDIRSRAF